MVNIKKQIDFSVVIPTFNRSHLVTHGITSALKQSGVLIEVIVIDDCSTDDTELKIKDLKDRRIKYFKNKKRLGYALNLKKCFYKATGDYIFNLGDDDFILEDDALLNILKIMKKYKMGVGKIGSIAFASNPMVPSKIYSCSDELIILRPGKDKQTLLRALDLNLASFSGLIFDNDKINKSLFINQINFPYFPMALEVIKKFGIAYIPNYFIVYAFSYQMVSTYVSLKKHGGFYLSDLLAIIEKFVDQKDYELYKKKAIKGIIIMLPTIKLYSDNKNLLSIIKILVKMDSSIVFDLRFIIFALLAFIPKFLIELLRFVVFYLSERKTVKLVNRYNYFQKLDKWDFIQNYE